MHQNLTIKSLPKTINIFINPENSKPMKKVLIFAITAFVVCSFAFVSCGQSGDSTETTKSSKKSSPSATLEKVLKELKNKDYKAALMYTVGTENYTEEEVNGFAELMQMVYEANGGLKDYEILSETISEDGQAASVAVKCTFGNGEVQEDTEQMVLTENGWKIAE